MRRTGPGLPGIIQRDPARIELYDSKGRRTLAIPYASVERTGEALARRDPEFCRPRLMLREEFFPLPMFAASFASGASFTMLDPAPRGDRARVMPAKSP
jgi:hypothetical protein